MEAARFGEGRRVRVLCGRAGTVRGPEPFCEHRPPPPGTQTLTHWSAEGCHGSHTLRQAEGAPPLPAAGSPPVTSPGPSQGTQGQSLGCISCPQDAHCTPLDLRLMWGSGANTEAGVRQVGSP